MKPYPIYLNSQLVESLCFDVDVVLKNGILSVCVPNQFGAEETVYEQPYTFDRSTLGPLFAKCGHELEGKLIEALSTSSLWAESKSISQHVNRQQYNALAQLAWYLPGLTPRDFCCVGYRLDMWSIMYFVSSTETLSELIVTNPLNLDDVVGPTIIRPDGRVGNGKEAFYGMVFDIIKPI